MDQSAPASKGLKVVRYPPAGFVPADFFSKGHAWSVAFVTGPWSSKVSPKATVAELDEHYVPGPKSLETRAWVAEGGYGTTNCVGFAPLGVEVAAGRRYLATLSLDGGATTALQYVVEFSEPIEQAPAQPK